MSFFSIVLSVAFAQTPRISSTNYNLASVDKVIISPGLVSVLEFPQNIIEVRVGDLNSVKAIISKSSPRELTVYLSNSSSRASNLIVRAEKKIYVFDIVPSKSNHQDYVKIKGSYGSPTHLQTLAATQAFKIEPNTKVEPKYHVLNNQTVTVEP